MAQKGMKMLPIWAALKPPVLPIPLAAFQLVERHVDLRYVGVGKLAASDALGQTRIGELAASSTRRTLAVSVEGAKRREVRVAGAAVVGAGGHVAAFFH